MALTEDCIGTLSILRRDAALEISAIARGDGNFGKKRGEKDSGRRFQAWRSVIPEMVWFGAVLVRIPYSATMAIMVDVMQARH